MFKKSLICLCLFGVINESVANKDFEITIGNTSPNARKFAEGEVIELKGTKGTGKQVKSEFMQNLPMTAEDEKSLIENAFSGNGDAIVLNGGKGKGKTTPTPVAQPTTPVVNNSNSDKKTTKTYQDFAQEIPIPTDFNILNQALGKHTSMLTSVAPAGLPDFFGFEEVVSDKDIRNLINTLTNAGKKKVNWDNVDLDVKTEETTHKKATNHNTAGNGVSSINEPKVELALNRIEREWYEPLKKETQLMMLSGLPMKVVLVPSRDDLMYQFMLSDVAKGSEERLSYKKFDDGIFSVLGMPLINGKKIPMCYIVFDNLIEDYATKILNPLRDRVGVEATSALVVGHNIGICLDELERQRKAPNKNTWFANEVYQIGLHSDSFQALFPLGMKSTLFSIKERELMSSNAQRQYQQRVADSFAVLWAYNRGYKNAYNAFIEVKDYVSKLSTHYTVPALKGLEQKLIAMRTNVLTLSNIWKIARQNQKTVGVEKEIKSTYEANYIPQGSELKQNKSTVNIRGLNTLNDVRNMKTLKKMGELPTSRDAGGKKLATMNEMRTFESVKNNQLASMDFNVRQLINQEPKRHEVVKHVKSESQEAKPKVVRNMDQVARFGSGVNDKNKVEEISKAQTVSLDGGVKVETTPVKPKEAETVSKKQELPTEKVSVKDEVRDGLLRGSLSLDSKGSLSF